MSRNIQKCPEIIKNVKICPEMSRSIQKFLGIFKNVQTYSEMSKHDDRNRSFLQKLSKRSKNVITKKKYLRNIWMPFLAKHRLTHSEERRYHCNICGKAFKRQDHLNGHLLTHRSTKPFACHVDGCGKSYCDARSLRRHKENHHGQAKPESKSLTSGLFMSFSEQF